MNILNKNAPWGCAILAINKYKHITSAKLVDQVKEIIFNHVGANQEVKVGHGGTLDSSATGVLVIGTGTGCKLLPNFLHGIKQYRVKAYLGIETDTYNECGAVVKEMPWDHVTKDILVKSSHKFVGSIFQIPPKYSALKLGGRRIADLTREGVEVSLTARRVHCYSINLLAFEPPTFDLEVTCGGGFYVRSLVHDLGHAMNTCAHVIELHRTRHGFISEALAVSSEELKYEYLVSNAKLIEEKSEYQRMLRKHQKYHRKPVNNRNELWFDPT